MTTLNRPGAPDGHVCGIDAAMEIIGGKWKVLILWALDDRPARRFGELRRLLPGVTEKVLASHLREMEADGIVRRVSYEEVPPRVEYSLTASGARLNAALVPLADWGRERVAAARAAGAEAPVGRVVDGRAVDEQAAAGQDADERDPGPQAAAARASGAPAPGEEHPRPRATPARRPAEGRPPGALPAAAASGEQRPGPLADRAPTAGGPTHRWPVPAPARGGDRQAR
ncbi:winged helix-turn-helix transcriptional regulator [Streptomyces sp. CMB-StM0423]|uniref:winged helix-turn-helix transcriptional regulator n=1 Tax=Streptomyces sp. CMB-StM0423 TaxID=2059884 RepID=UPI0026C7E6F6